jgi:TonB family protein
VTAGRSLKDRLLGAERAICRLLVCAAASLALHAVTLALRGPVGTSPTDDGRANTPVIQAVLMPSPLSSTLTESLMRDSQTRHPTTQPHVLPETSRPLIDSWSNKEALPRAYLGDGERGGAAYPATDKWHTAEEVDVRAEPLTPVHLGYPEHLAARVRGRVRIALFIDERGWVRKAQVLASEPERLFDLVAIQAWQDVRFSPALKGDLPVKSEKVLEIDFMPH